MSSIQTAIDAATNGDTVKVLEGEYVMSSNMLVPEGISLTLDPGVKVQINNDSSIYCSLIF